MDSKIRMTEGSIFKCILLFAWPVFLGNVFQQLYNLVDTLIVGNVLGNSALAAVSSTANLVHMLVVAFSGLSVGAGVVIARYFGAGEITEMRKTIHTDLVFGFVMGFALTAFGFFFTPFILRWMDTPLEVFDLAQEYLRMYFAGSLGLVLYNTCTGILQAVGDSKHPLQYLVISSILNVIFDILFVNYLNMGVSGAALATALAQMISVILCLYRLFTIKDDTRINLKEMKVHWHLLKMILSYGIPSSFGSSIISLASVIVQSYINHFGEMAMAGLGAFNRVEQLIFLPINSFSLALTTFVGQNLGAKKYDRAKEGARFGIICCVVFTEFVGLITFFVAPVFMKAFTQEAEAIAIGVQRAKICSFFLGMVAYVHATTAVLRGAGKPKGPMYCLIICWCVIRVLILKVMVPIVEDVRIVIWVFPITWILSNIVMAYIYQKSDWIHGFENVA